MKGWELKPRVLRKVRKLLDEWGVHYEDIWQEDEIWVHDRDESRARDAIEMAEGEVTMEDYEE